MSYEVVGATIERSANPVVAEYTGNKEDAEAIRKYANKQADSASNNYKKGSQKALPHWEKAAKAYRDKAILFLGGKPPYTTAFEKLKFADSHYTVAFWADVIAGIIPDPRKEIAAKALADKKAARAKKAAEDAKKADEARKASGGKKSKGDKGGKKEDKKSGGQTGGGRLNILDLMRGGGSTSTTSTTSEEMPERRSTTTLLREVDAGYEKTIAPTTTAETKKGTGTSWLLIGGLGAAVLAGGYFVMKKWKKR